jgi:amino acid transporter
VFHTIEIKAWIFIILSLIIIISVFGVLAPISRDAGNELGDAETICENTATCIYNTTASATIPCRDTANQSNDCATQDYVPPLGSLFAGTGIVMLIMVTVFLMVIIGGLKIAKR